MVLLGIGNPTIVKALNTSNNEPGHNGTSNNSGTDFGGLSARSVDIAK